MKKRKFLLWTMIALLVLSVLLVLWANDRVVSQTQGQLFGNVDSIPSNKVGLLLGTSKYLKSGKLNNYFEYRILATEALYRAGKIRKVVISGDNGRESYNEPQDMKEALVQMGIPGDSIYLDYAGFRTYDSVYRMKEIFGQSSFTIISQEFHNQRALYIANGLNIAAVGFNAKDVTVYNGFLTKFREKFARVKVIIDLTINKKPKFLGEKIAID